MVHDYGPGQRFATLHVEMSTNESPLECHELIDDMERECFQNHGVHLVIHYDPIVTGDPEVLRLKALVEEKGIYSKETRISDYDPDFITYLIDNIDKIYKAIVVKRDPLGDMED